MEACYQLHSFFEEKKDEFATLVGIFFSLSFSKLAELIFFLLPVVRKIKSLKKLFFSDKQYKNFQ